MESLPHLRDVFPEHFQNNSSRLDGFNCQSQAPLSEGNTRPCDPSNLNMRTTGHGPINNSSAANTAPRRGATSGDAPKATAPSFSVLRPETLDVVSTTTHLPTNRSWAAMQRPPALPSSSTTHIPMLGTHPDRRRHVCPICAKPFERTSSLQTHMHIHTGERPYICPAEGCGREFNAKSNMLRHYRGHSQR
ncbi:hypothetical protein EYR36_005166 [Pleurotus pulmonarius]|nr:hypothetical protein EYR36_005166 [Pleurotus pulmonarius]